MQLSLSIFCSIFILSHDQIVFPYTKMIEESIYVFICYLERVFFFTSRSSIDLDSVLAYDVINVSNFKVYNFPIYDYPSVPRPFFRRLYLPLSKWLPVSQELSPLSYTRFPYGVKSAFRLSFRFHQSGNLSMYHYIVLIIVALLYLNICQGQPSLTVLPFQHFPNIMLLDVYYSI